MSFEEWKAAKAEREVRLERIRDEVMLWGGIRSLALPVGRLYFWLPLIYAFGAFALSVPVAYFVVQSKLNRLWQD